MRNASSSVGVERSCNILPGMQRCGSKNARVIAILPPNAFLYRYLTVARGRNQIANFATQDVDGMYLRKTPGFGSSDLDVRSIIGS